MKNLLIILVVFLAISCSSPKTIDDVRMIKVGMTAEELSYFMGEAFEVRINSDNEELFFSYDDGVDSDNRTLCVTIVNGKIESFYSY